MSRSTPVRRAARVAARSGFVICLAFAAGMIALPLLGYERYVITGGSMGDTIARGSIVWDEAVPVDELRVGDVITYTPPRGAGPAGMVTHRIVSIGRERDGRRVYRTKGDANASADPWRFHLDGATQARVAFHLPHAGYVLVVASDRTLRTIGVGIPALLIVILTFGRLWRDAGERAAEGSPA
ncbi:MAG TPA: signal peptidase I [Solirubrobacteraceae bacterium]|jgi:signal peptidase